MSTVAAGVAFTVDTGVMSTVAVGVTFTVDTGVMSTVSGASDLSPAVEPLGVKAM